MKVLDGRRILLVRNDKIGDLVLALPLLQALKDAGAFVGLWASDYAAPLLEQDKRVDLLIRGSRHAEALAKAGFDTALCLWPTWGNAWALFKAGIPARLGADGRLQSLLFTRRLPLRRSRGDRHESEWNLDFARALGWSGPSPAPRLKLAAGAKAQAKTWLRKQGPKGTGPLVMLHPGSRGSAQDWAPSRFAALGAALKARLLITGGPGDEAALEACAQLLPKAAVLRPAPGLPLPVFAALLGQADLVCANSTGPLHLAAAQDVPVLGFYPPVRSMSALRWGPRGSKHAVLSPAGLGFQIPPEAAQGTMDRISVDEAVAAAAFLLR